MEPDAHPILRHENNFIVPVGQFDADQPIPLFNLDADHTALARIGVLAQICFLHNAHFRGHEQVLLIGKFFHPNERGNLLVRTELEEVGDGFAF